MFIVDNGLFFFIWIILYMKILFYLYASEKVTKQITLNQLILPKFIHAFILPYLGILLLSLHYLKYTIKYRIRQKSAINSAITCIWLKYISIILIYLLEKLLKVATPPPLSLHIWHLFNIDLHSFCIIVLWIKRQNIPLIPLLNALIC